MRRQGRPIGQVLRQRGKCLAAPVEARLPHPRAAAQLERFFQARPRPSKQPPA